jgi:hypothetical protein
LQLLDRIRRGLTVENGRITGIYSIVNPHKLARLDAEATLAR